MKSGVGVELGFRAIHKGVAEIESGGFLANDLVSLVVLRNGNVGLVANGRVSLDGKVLDIVFVLDHHVLHD